MSTCPVCGHYWAWHDDSGCRVTTSATNCTCTENETTMTDKTPPYVIDFDQIKPGQLIEREWAFKGARFRAEGIAHRLSPEGQWCTAVGGVVADRADSTDTLRVLAEPPAPALPETPGTVITCTLDGHPGAVLVRDNEEWSGLAYVQGYPDGIVPGWDSVPPSALDRITDWAVVYDPSAPKADDGLRERVEALADGFESLPEAKSTGRYVAYHLRHALAETSAS